MYAHKLLLFPRLQRAQASKNVLTQINTLFPYDAYKQVQGILPAKCRAFASFRECIIPPRNIHSNLLST